MGNNNSKVTVVTEGAIVQIGGETLLKLPVDKGNSAFRGSKSTLTDTRPSPSDLFDLVLEKLEKIALTGGYKFSESYYHKYIKDIRLSDIRENYRWSSGSFLGVSRTF